MAIEVRQGEVGDVDAVVEVAHRAVPTTSTHRGEVFTNRWLFKDLVPGSESHLR